MPIYYVDDFGAIGDGSSDDVLPIKTAIKKCYDNGGGTVLLSSGKTYLSSSFELLANVDLHLEKGSTLKASSNINDYIRPNKKINDPKTALNGNPVTGKPSFVFIYAKDQDNISITGQGTIDANGMSFVEEVNQYYITGDFYPRPTTIYVEHCNHISFKEITITNSPFWTLHPAGCYDVLISEIRILNSLRVANSDGIDPDHCQNVRIVDCYIQCADDCIALKNTAGNSEYDACENIIISGCTLISTSSAIKIGTEGINDFKNIIVNDCIVTASNRGIAIQIRDGGHVENVSFSNIMIETRRFSEEWWGCAEPIYITTLNREEKIPSGNISNIRFFNIHIESENGIFVYGAEPDKISNLTFDHVNINISKKSKWPCGYNDLRPGHNNSIISKPTSGFFIENASTINLYHCCVNWKPKKDPSFESAIECESVKDLYLQHFQGRAAFEGQDNIKLTNVTLLS